jgi:predicted FMN-binding regulatory protein PaiB
VFPSGAYARVPWAEVEAFVRAQRACKVLAVDSEGFPQVSILPFVWDGAAFEVHLVREDPTCRALEARGQGSVLLDEFLAFTPHHLVDPEDAGYATLHFRAVLFRVRARVSTEPAEVAAALERLLRAYEGDARWEPVADGRRYGARLRQLATARLEVVGAEAKFKVAQTRTPAERGRLLAYLEAQGTPEALRAAAVLAAAGPAEGAP